ncbi:MAG: proline--tRNA ligase [Leptospiraceae bacterium]|nr:proline--tRNA ligase [Leptospiraceae bacterium]
MRSSQLPLFTSKNDPADAQVASHRLLVRAGYIRKQASGLYTYLPFGDIVHRKIEQIIREEMDRFGAIEVSLPIITPAELWQESGRWDIMGKEMMRFFDRHEVAYALGPTHEEAMTDLARSFLQSYRQLPVNLYQIGRKYRDEIRPRYGLIRCREFTMKDAYSFHADEASLEETYQKMRECYRAIFERCGLKTIPVEADSGTMGGSSSEEFMVASAIGEEVLLLCSDAQCGYRANQEKTPYVGEPAEPIAEPPAMEDFDTGELKTVEQVAALTGKSPRDFIKAVVLEDAQKVVVCFIPGDRELSEAKVKNLTGLLDFAPAGAETIRALTGAEPGFTGPVGLKFADGETLNSKTVHVLFDRHLAGRTGLIAGANRTGFHKKNVTPGRDFVIKNSADIVAARAGDLCPKCRQSKLTETRGIEVGHIFKLGKKYAEKMGLTVLDASGKHLVPTMGCYGIGVGRTLATAVEQNHDERGIIWHPNLAPFWVYLISLAREEKERSMCEELYHKLKQAGVSVYLDERDERAGVKFHDAELVGFPFIVTVGKRAVESGKLELTLRRSGEKLLLETDELITQIRKMAEAKAP